jgi:hypothetical protein
MIIPVAVDDPDARYAAVGHDVEGAALIGNPGAIRRNLRVHRSLELEDVDVLQDVGSICRSCCEQQYENKSGHGAVLLMIVN